MEIKILQVFYDKNGLPYKDKERTVHYPITSGTFLGASNTTQIRFYYDQLDELNESTFVAVSKLPNGKIGSEILKSEYDSELQESYAILNLSQFYTQYKGDVYISLQGYQGGVRVEQDENGIYSIIGTPTIQATGSIKLSIAYAPTFVGSGQTENITLQRVLAELSTKLGIRQETLHVEELPTVGNPNVWYVVNDDPNDTTKANIYIWNTTTQTYVWVGDNTLDLGNYYTQEQGEQFESNVDNRVTSVENELSSVASGSPKGVYATVSDLESAFPTGDENIYLVGTKWYYWNGSAWTEGGTYLSSSPDDALSKTSTNSLQNKVITENILAFGKDLNGIVAQKGSNLLDISTVQWYCFFVSDGTIVSYGSSSLGISAPIFLKAGTYTQRRNNGSYGSGNLVVMVCDAYGNKMSMITGTPVEDKNLFVFTLTSDCFIRLNCTQDSYLVSGELSDYPATIEDFYFKLPKLKLNDSDTDYVEQTRQLLSDIYIKKGTNLFDKDKPALYENKFYNHDSGLLDGNGYAISAPIFLKAGTYTVSSSGDYGTNSDIIFTDINGNIIGYTVGSRPGDDRIIFTLSNDGYVAFNYVMAQKSSWQLLSGDYWSGMPSFSPFKIEIDGLETKADYENQTREMLNSLNVKVGQNLYDKNRTPLYSNAFFSETTIVEYSNFEISHPIFLKAGTYTVSSGQSYGSNVWVMKCDINGNNRSALRGTKETTDSPLVFVLTEDSYVLINVKTDYRDTWQLVSGSYPETLPSYEPYTVSIDGLVESQIEYKSSLTNKTWYVCGDSATQGDFSSIDAPRFEDGMYAGQLKVYPFFIGNRTGMDVHNIAISGGTIATINDQPSRYQFSKDGNYNSVPTSADYITIWFGANDMWQNVPIGTIDSNDPTTFYGAWNKVLSYYVNNYPNTKLGIVVSFWMTQQYAEAVIAVAAKYGIPTLNMYNDPKVPVTVGSRRPDVADSVKSARNNQWVVSNTNSHPSAEYHEIESYFIEEWLKTL